MTKLIIDNRTELSDADALTYVMSFIDQQTRARREGQTPIKTRPFNRHYGGRQTIFVNYDRLTDGDQYTVWV